MVANRDFVFVQVKPDFLAKTRSFFALGSNKRGNKRTIDNDPQQAKKIRSVITVSFLTSLFLAIAVQKCYVSI